MDSESVFDNSMDVVELPAGMTDKAIDETAEIDTRGFILCAKK